MTHLELAFESGDESLSVRSFRVEEGLNAFFTVAITARSVDPDLDLASFVGQDAAFFLAGGVERQRRWTGVCSRMEQVRVEPAGLSTYDLTIMPRLWFLTQRRNHRIFQHQSIPSILQRLLAEWGIEPVWNLDRGQYPGLELRIQYGESDYAFLSRLVEEAGITFFFVGALSQARPIPQVQPLPRPPPLTLATEKSAQRAPEPRARRPRGTPPPSRHRRAFGRCSSRCRSRKIEAGTSRPRERRRFRRQPEVREDRHDHLALRDVTDDRPPPTARAGQNIHQINAP